MISVMYREDPKDSPVHTHDFLEIIYIIEGRAIHNCKGKQTSITKGNYFLIDYNSEHQIVCKSHDFKVITCTFVPEFIDETLEDCNSLDELMHSSMIRYSRFTAGQSWADRIFHDDSGKIGLLLNEMVEEHDLQMLGCNEIFRCHLKEILILTLRMLAKPSKAYSDSIINDLISYIDKHYSEPITLHTFCEQKHYNLSYISRKFKTETGMTFREYVQKIRIEKCCELLSGSDLTIGEIARLVGYDDIQFFNSVFKRHLHLTPKEYKKLKQKID